MPFSGSQRLLLIHLTISLEPLPLHSVLEPLCLQSLLLLPENLHGSLVDLGRCFLHPPLFFYLLGLKPVLPGLFLLEEVLLVLHECVDVSDVVVLLWVVIVMSVLLSTRLLAYYQLAWDVAHCSNRLLLAVLVECRGCRLKSLLLPDDTGLESALSHLSGLLLSLGLQDLLVLPLLCLSDPPLPLIDVHFDFVFLLVFVHCHILLWYEQVGTFLVVELLDQFVVRLIEVLGSLDLVFLDVLTHMGGFVLEVT